MDSSWEEELQDERLAQRQRLAELEAEVNQKTERLLLCIETRDRAIERCQNLEAKNAKLREELLTYLHKVDKYGLEQLAWMGWGKLHDRIKELEGGRRDARQHKDQLG